ncbi:hypothetical protein [Fontibacter flavus]|uniref:GLPGLI family protein n=1 Tax=Fontibacter flavus TaxID=654838 RepID=A0ABV6FW89_9BACT
MSKNVFFLFFLLLISIFSEVKAQRGYEPGYVVTQSLDTIHGTIKDRKEPPFAKLYPKIRFKSEFSRNRKYSAKKIRGYTRGEDIFESQWILRYSRLFKTEYLSRKGLGKHHFMKVREKGFLTYYQWEFLDQESSTIGAIDLFKRRDEDYFIRVTQGLLGLKMNNLENYFEDYPELMEKIRNKELKNPGDIAKFYNDWLEVD